MSTQRFRFVGSGWQVFPLHLIRLLAAGGIALTLPFGLGAGVALEVRAFLTPLGLSGPWALVEQAIGLLPLASSGLVAVALWIVWTWVRAWLDRYRVEHTQLDEQPLQASAGCSPLPLVFAFLLLVGSLGLAAPWVMTWRKRRQVAGWKTPHGALAFQGSALGIASYGALSLLSVPFVVVTLGLAWIPMRFLWLRWEQSNLAVPTADGRLQPVVFEATLLGYVRRTTWRWACTIVTLGLYQPWAWIDAWSWTWSHTRLLEPSDSPSAGEVVEPAS